MMIRRILFAFWLTKAADTHSEYVMRIAIPRQWFSERALSVTFTYVASSVLWYNIKQDVL
jgi:hypothetical protein